MTAGLTAAAPPDPLATLREYRDAGALGPPRPRRPRRRHPRRLGRGAPQRRRAGEAERADHPVLRRPRAGEPARRPRDGRGVLLPPSAPGPRHQAAPDGGRHAGDADARVRRTDRRPDRAPGGRRASDRRFPRPDRLALLQAPRHGPRPRRPRGPRAGSPRSKARPAVAIGLPPDRRWPPASRC